MRQHTIDLSEIRALAEREEARWPRRREALHTSGVPLMEAGGAAATAAPAGPAGEPAAPAGTTPGTPANDAIAPELASRMEQMERSILGNIESLVRGPDDGRPQIDPNDPLAAFLADTEVSDDGLAALLGETEPQQPQVPDQFAQAIRALAQQRQEDRQEFERLAGFVQQQQLARDAQDLETRFPELRDQQAAQAAVDASTKFAESIGMPELAGLPQVVELVYKASKVDAAAASEVPAGGDHIGLEPGSGAAPVPQADVAQGILAAGRAPSFFT